mgnify:CR=1 FL=1
MKVVVDRVLVLLHRLHEYVVADAHCAHLQRHHLLEGLDLAAEQLGVSLAKFVSHMLQVAFVNRQ